MVLIELNDDFRDYVKREFMSKCRNRMKYGYSGYLVSKGFGVRFLSLVLTSLIVFLLIVSKYGINNDVAKDVMMSFIIILIVYGVVSFSRYLVEENEAKEKMLELCSELSVVAVDTVSDIILNMFGEVFSGSGVKPLYKEIVGLIRKKNELEHLIDKTGDEDVKNRLIEYLNQVDSRLDTLIEELIRNKHIDHYMVKALLDQIYG